MNERTTDQIASARQPPYLISTVAIHEPFATHNQWTSLSDLGDQFCLEITFSGEIENSEFSESSKISESELLAKCVLSMSTYF